jgi:hypothetical protein
MASTLYSMGTSGPADAIKTGAGVPTALASFLKQSFQPL